MTNIELKARCADLGHAEETTRELGAVFKWRHHQIDSYFGVQKGRLKIREVEDRPAELISYNRANEPYARPSEYTIYATEHGENLKEVLAKTLGVTVTVDKIRALYLLQNVRIHLDEVSRLGTFIEFEAVITEDDDEIPKAEEMLGRLRHEFRIEEKDLVPLSYADLLLQLNQK
jgi:adenylate cyclase class 2